MKNDDKINSISESSDSHINKINILKDEYYSKDQHNSNSKNNCYRTKRGKKSILFIFYYNLL